MLIDWCPGGPQIRTGCVLDAGTCIQYASSTKWAIPKSPKKDKKFFSLTFLSRPCDKTSRPCDKTSRPPPIFVTFMSRPCDKTSRPCDKTSRPLPIFHFFWSQDCDKTSRPFTPPQSFEKVLSNFCIARLRQNVTPL